MVVIWNMSPVRSEPDEKNESVPKRLCELTNHLSCVNSVRWSRDGKYLASGGDDAIVMIWQISHQGHVMEGNFGGPVHEQWRCVHMLRGHSSDVLDLSWSPDHKFLASCSVDNSIVVWNAKELPQKLTVLNGHQGLVKGVTWDPVGKYVASQSDDRSVRIWRVSDWKEVKVITEPFKKCGGTTHVLRLSWSPDGKYIVSAHALNNDGPTAQIIERGSDWKTGMDFVGHRKAVEVVLFNPHMFVASDKKDNHGCLALGSRDRTLSVWLTNLKRPLLVMHDLFKDSILDLSWSSDGYELLVCSTDGTVAYLSFTKKELGLRLSKQAFDDLYMRTYGFKRTEMNSKSSGLVLIETPEMLKLHSSSAGKVAPPTTTLTLKQSGLTPEGKAMATGSSSAKSSPSISRQVETRTKDGKRRITPITLTTETTSALGAPLPFTSFSPKQNKGATVMTTPEKERSKKPASGSEQSTPKSGVAEVSETDASSVKPISFEPLSPKNDKVVVSSATPTKKTDQEAKKDKKSESEEATGPGKTNEGKTNEGETPRLQKRPPEKIESALPKAKKLKRKPLGQSVLTGASHKSSPLPKQGSTLSTVAKQVLHFSPPPLESSISFSLYDLEDDENKPTVMIHNERTRTSACTIEYSVTSGTVWKMSFSSPCLKVAASSHVTCIACQDKSVSIFSSATGRLVVGKLYQCGDVLELKVRDHYVMYVSCLGDLSIWNAKSMKSVVKGCSFLGILSDSMKPPSDYHLTKHGFPVVLVESSKYIFNLDMECWMELCSAKETSEMKALETVRTSATDLLPLESFQRDPSLVQGARGSSGTGITRSDVVGQMLRAMQHGSSPQSSTLGYLESQISRSLCLKSLVEYQHWCDVYVQLLVKDNLEARLREFCSSFATPVGKNETVLGFSKTKMLRGFLDIIAKNPTFQRLYQELKDTVDQSQRNTVS